LNLLNSKAAMTFSQSTSIGFQSLICCSMSFIFWLAGSSLEMIMVTFSFSVFIDNIPDTPPFNGKTIYVDIKYINIYQLEL
ncbi:MAG: hypothetical protein K8R06_03995, partial [Methanosarcinales archaeon]|nr:hypothetical protein [Methanosarcinales archaeon]